MCELGRDVVGVSSERVPGCNARMGRKGVHEDECTQESHQTMRYLGVVNLMEKLFFRAQKSLLHEDECKQDSHHISVGTI